MEAQREGSGVERLAGERETYCDMRSMWRRELESDCIGAMIFKYVDYTRKAWCGLRREIVWCWRKYSSFGRKMLEHSRH